MKSAEAARAPDFASRFNVRHRIPVLFVRFLAREWPRDGRVLLLSVVACYFAALLVVSRVTEGLDLWRLLGVPTIAPGFMDTRVITTGWECTRQGFDVLVENPCDPLDRPVNYPRLWMSISASGLGEETTTLLGVGLAIAFFVAVFLLIGHLTPGEAAVYSAALLSPSVMLAVERANNDLLVFAIIAVALALLRKGNVLARATSYGLFLFVAVLKLYPAFAFTALLRQPRKQAAVALTATLAVLSIYVAATLDDLVKISEATPREVSFSYGAAVIVDGARERIPSALPVFDSLTPHVDALLHVVGIGVALAFSLWLAQRLPRLPAKSATAASMRRLDAFCVGASVYVGTFILGNNFDYRLIFLLFTFPQMLHWIETESAFARFSVAMLFMSVGTLWLSLWLNRLPFPLPLDEVLNWLLFVFFAAMLRHALSPWLAQFAAPRLRGAT